MNCHHKPNKSSSGDEILERDVTYVVLYDYLFTTLQHTCTSGPEYFSKYSTCVTYNGRRLTKSALHIFAGYYPLSEFLA